MDIEKEVFKKAHVDYNKLISYGFKKEKNEYKYAQKFMNDNFKADITIDMDGNIFGRVYDLQTKEEYTNIRLQNNVGTFTVSVKEEYKNILENIRKNCFETAYFISNQANRLTLYIKDKYEDEPEFLWEKDEDYGVFRNKTTGKWYGLIMNIDKSKLDNGKGKVEIINLKVNQDKIIELLNEKGFYKAYHMNKKHWISIILDDSVSDKVIFNLIDDSYNYTIKTKPKN